MKIMKSIFQYINEALRIKSGTNVKSIATGNLPKKYFPKEREELMRIIGEKYAENDVEIDVSDIDTSEINNFSNLFSKLEKLKYIHGLNTWNTEQVTITTSMFFCCYSLKELDLTGWETSRIVTMYNMFAGCHTLTTIKGLETWDTSKCTSFQQMFHYCQKLKNFNINNWDVKNIITTFEMFVGCEGLQKQLDLSKWELGAKPNKYRFMMGMFSGCRNLITLGDISNWDVSNIGNANKLFYGCTSLQNVGDIGKWNFTHCTDFSSMFENCSLLIVDVSNWKLLSGARTTKMFYKTNSRNLKKCKK
jgi:surface protein